MNLICRVLFAIYLIQYLSCCDSADMPPFENYVIPADQIYFSMNIEPERIFADSSVKEITEHKVSSIEYLEPNYCGKYLIFTVPCGNMCERVGIINCENGIISLPALPTAELGVIYLKNSSLFVVNPTVNVYSLYGKDNIPDWMETTYYKFDEENFILLKTQTYPSPKQINWNDD